MSGETTEEILYNSDDKPDLVLESGEDILNSLSFKNLSAPVSENPLPADDTAQP